MFHLMEEHRLILSIDMLEGDTQVEELRDVITECPNLKIAIGHFGMVTFPGWTEQIKLARYPNVFIESGGITWLFNDEFYPFKGAVRAIREAAGTRRDGKIDVGLGLSAHHHSDNLSHVLRLRCKEQ